MGAVSEDPYWWYYHVYFYPLMVPGNMRDMHTAVHCVSESEGIVFGHWLSANFPPHVLRPYKVLGQAGVGVRQNLRALLIQLGAYYWMEVSVGNSYHGLFALDYYEKVYTPALASRVSEPDGRYYLMNVSVPWQFRQEPEVFKWWQLEDFVSMGQYDPGGH